MFSLFGAPAAAPTAPPAAAPGSEDKQFRLHNTSKVKPDVLDSFTASTLEEDLLSIPTVGQACAAALKGADIHSSFQLLGKFLQFKAPSDSTQEYLSKFVRWLASISYPKGFEDNLALLLANKADQLFPGVGMFVIAECKTE